MAPDALGHSPATFTVIAIIAAYNEADIIGQVIAHLIGQGVAVYLLDHGSSDATVAEAKPYLGRGLLGIESFTGTGTDGDGRVSWAAVLRRKEQLARDLPAHWLIHHDADEFRESPWGHLDLRGGLALVDRLGYNAVDFEVFNFWPTRDGFTPGDDIQLAFRHYAPAEAYDRIQIKAWRKNGGPVDLVASGGHEAIFPGRRVFPIRFIMRHYPIRSQAHGLRKVLRERKARFAEEEQRHGWHVQYAALDERSVFIRDPHTLTPYDAEAARVHVMLHHRDREPQTGRGEAPPGIIDSLQWNLDVFSRHLDERNREVETLSRQLHERNLERESLSRHLDERNREVESLSRQLHERNQKVETLSHQLHQRNLAFDELHGRIHERNLEAEALRAQVARVAEEARDVRAKLAGARSESERLASELAVVREQLTALYASLSWRSTEPMRAIARALNRYRRG